MRTFSDDVTSLVEKQMRRIVEMTCAAHGAEAKFDFHWNYPPTVNDVREAEFAATVMDDIVGADNVVRNIEPTMGAEDFAFMLKAKAGAYVFIGNGDGTHRAAGHGLGPCMLHNPSYDFNDELIPLGATYWVRLAQTFLARLTFSSFPLVHTPECGVFPRRLLSIAAATRLYLASDALALCSHVFLPPSPLLA